MPHDRGPAKRIETLDEMQIAVADPGCGSAHQDLVLLRIIDVDLLDRQRLIGGMKYGGLHMMCAPIPDDENCIFTYATFRRALANGLHTICAPTFHALLMKNPASDCRFMRFMISVAPAKEKGDARFQDHLICLC